MPIVPQVWARLKFCYHKLTGFIHSTSWRDLGLLTAIVIVGLILTWFTHKLAPELATLKYWITQLIQGQGPWDMLEYLLATAVLMCIFVPRQALSFVGGVLFGGLLGGFLATLGCTLGCGLAMGAARYGARNYFERKYTTKLAAINAFLLTSPVIMSFNLRLIPTGNNLLFCFLGGLTQIPAKKFILGSGLGYLPQNLIFSFLGSGLSLMIYWQIGLAAAGLGLATLLSYFIYKKYSRQL